MVKLVDKNDTGFKVKYYAYPLEDVVCLNRDRCRRVWLFKVIENMGHSTWCQITLTRIYRGAKYGPLMATSEEVVRNLDLKIVEEIDAEAYHIARELSKNKHLRLAKLNVLMRFY